jgi:NADH-quinone oxidoreductase subunit H
MFLMADFLETVVVAGMTTALFLGGWQVPWLMADGFHLPGGPTWALPATVVVTLQVVAFVTKVVAMCWFLMLVRWTLPRFRYDQAMRLGWLVLLPLAVLNVLLTGGVMLLWDRVAGP